MHKRENAKYPRSGHRASRGIAEWLRARDAGPNQRGSLDEWRGWDRTFLAMSRVGDSSGKSGGPRDNMHAPGSSLCYWLPQKAGLCGEWEACQGSARRLPPSPAFGRGRHLLMAGGLLHWLWTQALRELWRQTSLNSLLLSAKDTHSMSTLSLTECKNNIRSV